MIHISMIRKTLLAVSVMGIFLLASGEAMALFNSAPYFPLTASSNWVYRVDDASNATITVNPTLLNINGVDTTRLDTSSSTATNGSRTFNTSDGNGIRLHRRFIPNGVPCPISQQDLTLTFSPPVIFAEGMTDIGSIANTAGTAEAVIGGICGGPHNLSYTASFTVNGFETVTVPAGIFYDVLKITGSIHVTGTVTVLGQPRNVDQTLATTLYLALNIGPIKGLGSISDPENPGPTSTSVLTGSTFLPAAATALAAAVLPSSRFAQVGTPVTAFATIINGGGATATQCGLSALLNSTVNPLPITFGYQITDAGNHPIGSPNTPVDIGAGAPQGYVFSVMASGPFAPTDLKIIFDCTNTNPAPIIVGVSTLLLSASAGAVADIVALIATNPPNDGIARIPTTDGSVAFGVATVNVGGAGASITASADTGGVALPVSISVCETNPANGQCISAIGPTVTTQIDPGETNTFSFFVTGSGNITFDPATKRIFARFKVGAVTHGSSSVAVCTDTDPSCP